MKTKYLNLHEGEHGLPAEVVIVCSQPRAIIARPPVNRGGDPGSSDTGSRQPSLSLWKLVLCPVKLLVLTAGRK